MSATALLTRAFRTLRDPVSRGLYWLELQGEKLATDNKQVPPELAELIFEVQETLEELRDCASTAMRKERGCERRSWSAKQALDVLFKECICGTGEKISPSGILRVSDNPALIVQLKGILSRIAYLKTLIRDVDRELDVHRFALVLRHHDLNHG